MGAARRAALLMGAMFGVGRAFVPAGRASPLTSRAVVGDVAPIAEVQAGKAQQQQPRQDVMVVSGVAAALMVAAAVRRPTRGTRRGAKTVVCDLKPQAPAFTGATVAKLVEAESVEDTITCNSLRSCYSLYFKRVRPYKDRAKKNIRNRAYNIYHKNAYKRTLRTALKKIKEIQYGETVPATMEEVMTQLKPYMDDACLTIDEVAVQGILHRNTAARRKDRLCRAVLRALVSMGLAEKPDDPFVPAYEVIKYDMPVTFKTREPRPWQLPGWKSPWMLKKEYDMWKKQREARKAAA